MQVIHTNVASGNKINDWSKVIPEPYLEKLKSRLKRPGKLGDKLNNYQTALLKLTPAEQNRILKAFNEQNNIALLLACQCDCEAITDLPLAIREPVQILFKYAFEIITDIEIRHKQYHIIYESIPSHVCPFCGYEKFDALGIGSRYEALDHYLLKDLYPFAAANLLNLVPMGYKCNSLYKHTKNILYRTDGTRRRSFDPYNKHEIVKISLDNSEPFAGNSGTLGEPLPRWEINFNSYSEEISTWDEVFCIRERYVRYLDAEFISWVTAFGKKCQRKNIPNSEQELVNVIEDYASDFELDGFGEQAFLKVAVFRMLYIHCKNGNQRLISFLMNKVNPRSIA
ncbi:hypothetical protein I8752_30535 [Nostocaceae cyanobacterium CENA369]|uniref:Uncharacterized protein n=2 Tax=Dendronalium TaxID=2840442 RepID=A0A8J7I6X6_9NOST|nr:hypothetical protein [Dendronalium phyllosphericum CENA369]